MALGGGNSGMKWQEIAAKKQQEREDRIPSAWKLDKSQYQNRRNVMDVPETCGILTQGELDITSKYDAIDILGKIRSCTFSVEQVVTAFCKRAAIAQQVTNCLTEIFFDEAIATARQMDEKRLRSPNEPLPALFGLPISLKDQLNVPGFDATIGFISLAGKPATKYSALAQLLKDQGAVFYCKTNLPQTMMTADSDNNVFGRTLNPHNTALTAGGSSGGEGALVAMRGSIMGIGTDIGGSIRIPAFCCGIYGFKPTSGLVPYAGGASPVAPGTIGIAPAAGPMATSARDCAYLFEVIIKAKPWNYDAGCLNFPWLEPPPPMQKVLRIAYVEDDGSTTPTPPVRRALRISAEKLRSAGHDVIQLTLSGVDDIIEDCWAMFGADGAKTMLNYMDASGEPQIPSVLKMGLTGRTGKTLAEFTQLNFRRIVNKQRFAKLWVDNQFDVILCAAAPHTAPKIDAFRTASYTMLYNYLDWPGVVLPVGKVSAEDVVDGVFKYGPVDEEMYRVYTGPEDYAEAPTAIQLIGRPQEDQLLIQQAIQIDSILNARP